MTYEQYIKRVATLRRDAIRKSAGKQYAVVWEIIKLDKAYPEYAARRTHRVGSSKGGRPPIKDPSVPMTTLTVRLPVAAKESLRQLGPTFEQAILRLLALVPAE